MSSSRIACVVCGNRSTGKHYGQLTCDKCYYFFLHSIRGNVSYTCTQNGLCDVGPVMECLYCLFMKCLKMGMTRERTRYWCK